MGRPVSQHGDPCRFDRLLDVLDLLTRRVQITQFGKRLFSLAHLHPRRHRVLFVPIYGQAQGL